MAAESRSSESIPVTQDRPVAPHLVEPPESVAAAVTRGAVSERAAGVQPFRVMDIVARVARKRAQGHRVISLCVGEPGQGAPTAVRRRAAEVVRDGTGLGYSAVEGIPELREAISGHYRRWYGLTVAPERIVVTTGSSGGFQLAFLTCFDVGDRVALARPGYAAYKNILAALGCEVVELDCGPGQRFQPTVEQLEREHARAPLAGLLLASPANPTGTMVDARQLDELTAWADARGVHVVSDEIYHGITFTGSVGETALAHSRRAIVITSFSKFWGMTGWRLGWMVLPEDLVTPTVALASNLTLCAPVPSQYAAVEAFTDSAYAEGEAAVAGFAAARETVLAAVGELGWTDTAPADGAFYVYAFIDEVLGPYATATEWCRALLEQENVALSPGLDFDGVHGDRAVRLSLAAGADAVAEALERIKRFQSRLS